MLERERKIATFLLITGPGVRVPRNHISSVSMTNLPLWKLKDLMGMDHKALIKSEQELSTIANS
jgi:hypothetical protein